VAGLRSSSFWVAIENPGTEFPGAGRTCQRAPFRARHPEPDVHRVSGLPACQWPTADRALWSREESMRSAPGTSPDERLSW